MLRRNSKKRQLPRKKRFQTELLETRQLMTGDVVRVLDPPDVQAIDPQRDTDTQVLVAKETDPGGRGDVATDVKIDPGTDPTGGELREVAVAHVGDQGSVSYHVAAVGSGAEFQLSSWSSAGSMTHLKNAGQVFGHDVELTALHAATEARSSDSGRGGLSTGDLRQNDTLSTLTTENRYTDSSPTTVDSLTTPSSVGDFLSSWVGNDGNLWVSSKSISDTGTFYGHDTRGFGSNINVSVIDHAIALHPSTAQNNATQIVTPILVDADGELQLRVVTWQVSRNGLGISGQNVSEPLSTNYLPSEGANLSVHHSHAGFFEINFRDTQDRMATHYVVVTEDGFVLDGGGGNSGKSYTGGTANHYVDDFATIRLNHQASVAIDQQGDDVDATIWERRVNGCVLVFCDYEPYQLGDSDNDLRPNQPGVSVPLPNLTHAYGTSPGTGEHFGTSMAVGDFNGDGHQDVAVGSPGERVNGNNDAGAVTILYGSESGPYASILTGTITQDTPGIIGVADENDRFGHALVAADFDGDGKDDLAISAPGESIEAEDLSEVGVVHVLYGTDNGLTSANDILIRQGAGGAAGISESGDQFGWAMTSGDYNGDGKADLGVGIPFEDHNQFGLSNGGAVHVFYGSGSGITTANDVTFHQNSTGMLGSTAAGDEYGYSLASGDITGDGRDELVAGIPGKSFFGMNDAGAVHIVRGSAAGLTQYDWLVSQDGIVDNDNSSLGDISDSTEAGDRFGAAVTLGDFNGDGFDDLAISAPEEDHHGLINAGRVHIVMGAASGPTADGEEMIDQESPGVSSAAELGGRFGFSLTAGEVTGDNYDELLIGMPHLDREVSNAVTYANTGGAFLLKGSASGISTFYGDFLKQGSHGIDGEGNAGDHFGWAMSLADLNNDGYGDAIIGVPNETVKKLGGTYSNAGQVHLVWGDEDGLSDSDKVWVQGTTKHIRAKLADAGWEAQYGVGGGEIYESMPPGTAVPEHAASVTKTMTLLLAVEALGMPNSPIALDDVVTISEKAGTTGGSKMKGTLDGEEALLEPGDEITLEALLYGMMIHSGNRASVAIAEHVAVQVYGAGTEDLDEPFNVFVERMNDRADEIGLDDTRYGHPAGGSTTLPQDLITFWREAWQNPRFRTYAGARAAYPDNPATTVNTDTPKEFSLARNSSYVGHDGYKGGHGKVGDVYDEEGAVINTEICDECHVGSATRGGHTMVVGIQQSGNDGTNAQRLYDFGFESLFTPDRRGTNDYQPDLSGKVTAGEPSMGTISAIDLDHMVLGKFVSAAVDNHQLQLQLWSAVPNSGNIQAMTQSIETFDDLAQGTADSRDEVVDVIQLPSAGKVLGDYVSGVIEDGNLRLDLWRVGSNYVEPPTYDPVVIADVFQVEDDPEADIFELVQPTRPTTPLPGDANLDGIVDFTDFLTLTANFGKEIDAVFADGDFTADGRVSFADFLILSERFGQSV